MQGPIGRSETSLIENFRSLLADHEETIYRLAYRLSGNADDAQDLVQDSIIEAFQAFRRFQVGTSFDHWLRRIITRNYIDKARRQKKIRTMSLDEIPEGTDALGLANPDGNPEDLLMNRSYSEPVQMALQALCPERRVVITLCDIEGFSYEEASRILGIPVGTIRSRLHRARAQMRDCLSPLIMSRKRGKSSDAQERKL